MDDMKNIDIFDHLGKDAYEGLSTSPRGLLNIKQGSEKMVILLNGAVDRKRAQGPVFQRSSWTSDINSTVLNIADPTIAESNNLSIGWGQTGNGDALDDMSELAIRVSESQRIDEGRNRIYYGSSAGGFQAIQLAIRDPGSVAIVNNPQTDWTYYMRTSVNAVLRDVYNSRSVDEIRNDYPSNCNLVAAMSNFDVYPEIDYFVNSESSSDINIHLKIFLESIGHFTHAKALEKLVINLYGDKNAGHNPLPKIKTLDIINSRIRSK